MAAVLVASSAALAQGEEPMPPAYDDPLIGRWSVYSGVDYSSGDYGSEIGDTEILYAYGSIELELDRVRLKATVPWIHIEGPGGVTGGIDDPIITDPDATDTVSNSGLGDVVLEAGYLFGSAETALPFLEIVGKVKVPTADEDDGLGTGETDFSLQLDVFDQYGRIVPFATVGYKVFGDPEGFDLNNTLFASGGLSFEASERFSFGGSIDWREATTDTAGDTLEAAPFATLKFSEAVRLTGYGVFGFKDGSPDAGGGAVLRFVF